MSETKTTTYTKDQIDAMSPDALWNILNAPGAVWRATAVVRDRHGRIKYDDPSRAGQYGEEFLNG